MRPWRRFKTGCEQMKNKFEYWHPFTQIIYYIVLITVTVCFMHPVVIFLTLAAGLSLGFIMGRKKFLRVLFGMFVQRLE